MEENNRLEELDIKNCTCYYFGGITNINDLDLNNNLLDETSHENILLCDVTYTTPYNPKSLRIIFHKED